MIYELALRDFDCSLEFVFSLLLLQPFNFSPVSFACNFQDWGCVILREIDFLLKICWSIPCLHSSWKVHTLHRVARFEFIPSKCRFSLTTPRPKASTILPSPRFSSRIFYKRIAGSYHKSFMCRVAPESINHSGLSDEQIKPTDAENASSLSASEPFPVTASSSLFLYLLCRQFRLKWTSVPNPWHVRCFFFPNMTDATRHDDDPSAETYLVKSSFCSSCFSMLNISYSHVITTRLTPK